jgi:hypothetical protein
LELSTEQGKYCIFSEDATLRSLAYIKIANKLPTKWQAKSTFFMYAFIVDTIVSVDPNLSVWKVPSSLGSTIFENSLLECRLFGV